MRTKRQLRAAEERRRGGSRIVERSGTPGQPEMIFDPFQFVRVISK